MHFQDAAIYERNIRLKTFLKKYIGPIIILTTLTAVLVDGIKSGALPAALQAIRNAHPLYLFLAMLCFAVHASVHALAICSYLKQENYHLRFRDSLASIMTGIFFSNITPGATGGQPMQALYLSTCGIPVGLSASAVAAFMICWHIARLVLLALFALPCSSFIKSALGNSITVLLIGSAYNTVLVIALLLISCSKNAVQFFAKAIAGLIRILHLCRSPHETTEKLMNAAELFHSAISNLLQNPKELIRQLFYAFLFILSIVSVLYFAFRAVGANNVSYVQVTAMSLCQEIAAAYIPTPGASGAMEVVFRMFFGSLLDNGKLLAVMMIWRFVCYYFGLFAGAVVSLLFQKQTQSISQ